MLPGMRYCILTASSFSRSRRRQTAAQEKRMDEMRAKPTPIQAIMYDLLTYNDNGLKLRTKKYG